MMAMPFLILGFGTGSAFFFIDAQPFIKAAPFVVYRIFCKLRSSSCPAPDARLWPFLSWLVGMAWSGSREIDDCIEFREDCYTALQCRLNLAAAVTGNAANIANAAATGGHLPN